MRVKNIPQTVEYTNDLHRVVAVVGLLQAVIEDLRELGWDRCERKAHWIVEELATHYRLREYQVAPKKTRE